MLFKAANEAHQLLWSLDIRTFQAYPNMLQHQKNTKLCRYCNEIVPLSKETCHLNILSNVNHMMQELWALDDGCMVYGSIQDNTIPVIVSVIFVNYFKHNRSAHKYTIIHFVPNGFIFMATYVWSMNGIMFNFFEIYEDQEV